VTNQDRVSARASGATEYLLVEEILGLSWSLNQYHLGKVSEEMLGRAMNWPMRTVPAYFTTLIPRSFHSPLSQRNQFKLQNKTTIPSTEKYFTARGELAAPGKTSDGMLCPATSRRLTL
jgi:hypothetical protein